jgi:type IV secretory pathway TrbL component
LIFAGAIVEGITLVAEGATIAAGSTAAAIALKAYGSKILDAMGTVSPYSTPAVDFAMSSSKRGEMSSTLNKSESAKSDQLAKKQDQLKKNKEEGAKAEEKVQKKMESELDSDQEILDKPRVVTNNGKTTYPDKVVVDRGTKQVVKPTEIKSGDAKLSTGQADLLKSGGTIQSATYPEYNGATIKPGALVLERVKK